MGETRDSVAAAREPRTQAPAAGRALVKRALLLALTAGLASCAPPEKASTRVAVPWNEAPVARVRATIGQVEGPPEVTFGDIQAVALDGRSRIYVADRIGSAVRVYAPDGRFLRQIGREGRGPGEFEGPADLTFGPEGRLFVRDARRITVLAAKRSGGIPDSVAATWPIANMADARFGSPARFDAGGTYFDPAYAFPHGGSPTFYYVAVRDGVPTGDTVRVPPYANLIATFPAYYMLGQYDGRIVRGLAHAPFEAVPSWDLTTRGTVVGGDGRTPALVETEAAGDTLRTLPLPRPARRSIPAAARDDSLRAFRARLDSLPVSRDALLAATELVRSGRLPDSLPAFRSVRVDADGDLWVERWPLESGGQRTYYDVLAADGAYRGSLVLPVRIAEHPSPALTDSTACAVVRDPATGVERVVLLSFSFQAPGTGGSP